MPFIKIEVAIKAEKGPIEAARMSFKGSINKLIIKIPRGGIQIVRRIDEICVDSLHTY